MVEYFNVFAGHSLPAIKGMHEVMHIDFAIIESRKKGGDVEEYCKKNDIKLIYIEKKEDLEILAKYYRFNLVLSCSFGVIFPQKFINNSKYIINIHPGDIYKYRGRHPLPWAIINGEEMCSITAHVINSERIDDGPIIFLAKIPIEYNLDYDFNANRINHYSGEIAKEICLCYKIHNIVPTIDFIAPEDSYLPPLSKKKIIEITHEKTLRKYKRRKK